MSTVSFFQKLDLKRKETIEVDYRYRYFLCDMLNMQFIEYIVTPNVSFNYSNLFRN